MHWIDLLAIPFKAGSDDPDNGGIDCWGQARIVNKRVGRVVPELGGERPSRTISEEGCRALVLVASIGTPISTVALETGDMFFSDPSDLGYPSHVATVVEIGWAVSTCEKHGPYAWPVRRMACDCGVWRAPRSRP